MSDEPSRRPAPGRPRVAGHRRARPQPDGSAGAGPVAEPLAEEPLVAEPPGQEPLVEEPLGQEPLVEEPLGQEPLVAEPLVDEPLVEEHPLEEPRTSDRPSRRPRPLPAALTVLALLLTAACVVLGLGVLERTRTDEARREALAAAPARLESLLSYDHRTLDADFAEGQAAATGAFRREYGRTTTQVVRDTATRYKAVVTADVVGTAVTDASPDEVVVVAFVNQTTTSDRVQGPQVDQSRVRAVLRPVDGEWLVARLDAL